MQPKIIIEDDDGVKTVTKPDDIYLIGKRPVKSKTDGSLSLNYVGRVK